MSGDPDSSSTAVSAGPSAASGQDAVDRGREGWYSPTRRDFDCGREPVCCTSPRWHARAAPTASPVAETAVSCRAECDSQARIPREATQLTCRRVGRIRLPTFRDHDRRDPARIGAPDVGGCTAPTSAKRRNSLGRNRSSLTVTFSSPPDSGWPGELSVGLLNLVNERLILDRRGRPDLGKAGKCRCCGDEVGPLRAAPAVRNPNELMTIRATQG